MADTALAPRIRQAQLEDAERLADLATQLGYPSSAADIAARLRAIFADASHAVFVAELPGKGVRGFAHVQGTITLETGPRAELVGLVTDSAVRSRGLGALLVDRAEIWAREKGLQTLIVHCNVVRADAHRFYERQGYQCSKTQKHFRKSVIAGVPASTQ